MSYTRTISIVKNQDYRLSSFADISNNNPNWQKPGYLFSGWAYLPNATVADIQDSGLVTADKLTNDLNLYAVWEQQPPRMLLMLGNTGDYCEFEETQVTQPLRYVHNNVVQAPFNLSSSIDTKDKLIEVNDESRVISSIGDSAFLYCINLLSINCLNVSSIGSYAFYQCSNLSSLDCRNAISIGKAAFCLDVNLISVNCPNIRSVEDGLFIWCESLSSINCQSVSSIGYKSFCGCSSLISIDCPNVESIGDHAFNQCLNLTSINCQNVSSFGAGAFENCTSLSLINISYTTTAPTIGSNVFEGIDHKISVYVRDEQMSAELANSWIYYYPSIVDFIPHGTVFKTIDNDDIMINDGDVNGNIQPQTSDNSGIVSPYSEKGISKTNILKVDCCEHISSIGSYAFYQCSNLSSINCPNVSSIGDDAFYQCSSLTSVNCPNATSIGRYTFYDCSSLSSINCPNVLSILQQAFKQCSHSFSINLSNAITPTYIGTNCFANIDDISVYVKNDNIRSQFASDPMWLVYRSQTTFIAVE